MSHAFISNNSYFQNSFYSLNAFISLTAIEFFKLESFIVAFSNSFTKMIELEFYI